MICLHWTITTIWKKYIIQALPHFVSIIIPICLYLVGQFPDYIKGETFSWHRIKVYINIAQCNLFMTPYQSLHQYSAVQRTLHRYNLKVNNDKTEKTSLSKNEDAWRSTKKVGSLMGDKEDVERRKQLSNATLYKLKNIWIGKDDINHNIKIKLYKALVKSILTYNCGTWALAQTELN